MTMTTDDHDEDQRKAAYFHQSPPITHQQYDHLAQELAERALNVGVEEVFLVLRHEYSVTCPLLIQTPNRHENPAEAFSVWLSDVQPILERGFKVFGYVHTHTPREANSGPSSADLKKCPEDFIGGVYMPGHEYVYWYNRSGVFHSSPVAAVAVH
jgi:hypothetical protein